jgi:ribosomal protein L7/L12
MVVAELRCPRCMAPVGTAAVAVRACRYCGATLVVEDAPGTTRDEERTVLKVRVGPSNASRVTGVLEREGGLPRESAEAMVCKERFEIEPRDERASHLATALKDAGAEVQLVTVIVKVAVPPDVSVWLDALGSRKAAVIAALRTHVDLGIKEAKELVESVPCRLVERLTAEKGAALARSLADAGGRVHVEPVE